MLSISIAIPTYNRSTPLEVCLKSILLQNEHSIPILILDNCSDIPASHVIDSCMRTNATAHIRIIRNACNIGSAANVLRCMEYSTSDYLWIIGDDDCLKSNALTVVVETLARDPNLLAYNFSSGLFTHPTKRIVEGNDIFTDIPSFSNLLFISANIFNVKKLRANLPYGYQFAYSTGPHLAVLLASVNEHEKIGYFPECIVDPQGRYGEARWSVLHHWACLPILAEVLPNEAQRRKLLTQINQTVSLPILVVNFLVAATVWESSRKAFSQYRQCVWRHYDGTKGRIFTLFAIAVGWTVLYSRYLSVLLADIFVRKKGLRSISERCHAFEKRSNVL